MEIPWSENSLVEPVLEDYQHFNRKPGPGAGAEVDAGPEDREAVGEEAACPGGPVMPGRFLPQGEQLDLAWDRS